MTNDVLPIYVRTATHLNQYKLRDCILVLTWHDICGGKHEEEFMSLETCAKIDPSLAEMSWVHCWDSPAEGLRHFLSHCPLHDISVKIKDISK